MRVELRKGEGRQPWRLYLIGANNKILSVSEAYYSRWNAKRAARRNFNGIPFKDVLVSVAQSWLVIGLAVGAIWALWGVFHITFSCIEYWQAARRGEALTPDKEREQS